MSEEQIRYYFDFLCPYSYIGWLFLKKALAGKNLSTALYAVGNIRPGDAGNGFHIPVNSSRRWEKLAERGKSLGIKIKGPPQCVSSFPARRGLLKYSGIAREDFIDGVFRAVFCDGLDIGNARILTNFLQTEGVDYIPMQETLADPQTEKLAEDVTSLWDVRRIRLLPTVEIGEDRYAGLIDARGLENLLARVIF
ncbi:MAG: DsbA family protein [Candidatus Ozemobacteraceae bacterium]